MGGTVVADVLQKGGAHGAPLYKQPLTHGRGCAVRTMPLQLNTCSLSAFPQPTSWGGACERSTHRGHLIVSTLQRHQNGLAPSPGGVLFFACPKKRTKRKGSPAAETTPVDGLRNRRGKNSLRSNSLPLFPGSAPRRPAQRQRAVFLPRRPVMPRTVRLAGPAFHLVAGDF